MIDSKDAEVRAEMNWIGGSAAGFVVKKLTARVPMEQKLEAIIANAINKNGFRGNDFTAMGNHLEELIMNRYFPEDPHNSSLLLNIYQSKGFGSLDTQFSFGITPDVLVGDDEVIEIKTSYRIRKEDIWSRDKQPKTRKPKKEHVAQLICYMSELNRPKGQLLYFCPYKLANGEWTILLYRAFKFELTEIDKKFCLSNALDQFFKFSSSYWMIAENYERVINDISKNTRPVADPDFYEIDYPPFKVTSDAPIELFHLLEKNCCSLEIPYSRLVNLEAMFE